MNMIYIHTATPEFTKSTAVTFAARLKQANLACKIDIANCINKIDLYNKLKNVTSNKNELNELSKKVKATSTKALTRDVIEKLVFLMEQIIFFLEIFQNFLVFIPAKKCIKYFSGNTRVHSRKSNGM